MKNFLIILISLVFISCSQIEQILPKIPDEQVENTPIKVKFTSPKTYMKKYLPENIVLDENSSISLIYEFSDNSKVGSGLDGLNIFNPLVLVGFPLSGNSLTISANMKFFKDEKEINFSSVCVSKHTRTLFSNTNLTELRKMCAKELKENLQKQINISINKGEFNVFE